MVEHAQPSEVEEFAAGLAKQYLLCRTYGHSFNPYTVSKAKAEGKPSVYFEQVLRCKCRVKRYLLLSRTGAIITSRHDYSEAPGYLTQGIGRIVGTGRDTLRLESLNRLMGG